jgi:hypothetical protein
MFRQALIGNVEAPAATPRQLAAQGRGRGPLTHRQSYEGSAEIGDPVLQRCPCRHDCQLEMHYPSKQVQR